MKLIKWNKKQKKYYTMLHVLKILSKNKYY
jgi:hypothetical protein